MAVVKPLYLGKTMEDLNRLSNADTKKTTNPRMYAFAFRMSLPSSRFLARQSRLIRRETLRRSGAKRRLGRRRERLHTLHALHVSISNDSQVGSLREGKGATPIRLDYASPNVYSLQKSIEVVLEKVNVMIALGEAERLSKSLAKRFLFRYIFREKTRIRMNIDSRRYQALRTDRSDGDGARDDK